MTVKRTIPRRHWGEMARSSKIRSPVISPTDLSTHMYVVGGTGSGKTTLLKILGKHLERWNDNGTCPNAFIYIDPKGDDSEEFIRQCSPDTIASGRVHYFDPEHTMFSLNPLELPRCQPDEREGVVSRYVGYVMEMIQEWYQQSTSYVQMERIFRALLFYMYMNHDAPTFLDLHELILKIQGGGAGALEHITATYGEPEPDMKNALDSIAGLKPDSFVPLLNRVEQFATDHVLRRMFCVRRGTVDFQEMIRPGSFTVVRISPVNMPHHVQPLAMQTFVMKLWFAIQERASRTRGSERAQVVLALDEFQIVKDMQVIQLMLEQARSLGLGLILAHQTTEQISDRQLGLITGNSGTQLAGRVNGRDASRLAQAWDPQFKAEITQKLAGQEYFRWMMREKAPLGEEQPPPVQFWLGKLPRLLVSEQQYEEFVAAQLARYGRGIVEDTIFRQATANRGKWLESITVPFPAEMEWQVMLMLRDKPLQQVEMTARLAVSNRSEVLAVLRELMSRGLVEKTDPENRLSPYNLTAKARKYYFEPIFDEIGSAKEIAGLTRQVFDGYLANGMFVAVASQKVVGGQDRTDLVAYDYANEIPISVEIESVSEVQSHPEHVRHNMLKWRKMGFEQCHVWSKSPRIEGIWKSLAGDEKLGVKFKIV